MENLNVLRDRVKTVSEKVSQLKGQKVQLKENLADEVGNLKKQFKVKNASEAKTLLQRLETNIQKKGVETEALVKTLETDFQKETDDGNDGD